MTLSKQLLILISTLFLMIFSVNFIISVDNIRSYLEGESEVHAQDTATSLGLSLSPYMVDETDPVIETMMNAIFDMGYYQEIKLVNVDNKPLITLTNKKEYEGIPDWLIKYIPMKTAVAESEISSGWNISGTVYVAINPGYAYRKLYQQVTSSFYYSLGAFALSLSLLLIVLHFTLSSLKQIDKMAITIAAGEFITIDNLPWTTEVRNVTKSMNIMSKKIEMVISKLNLKLDVIGKKIKKDDLTGLNKKSSFDTDLKKIFISNSDIEAYIFVIKIDSLANLVKELGNTAIDQFLKDVANVLTNISAPTEEIKISAYRFFGSEFAMLLKHATHEQTESIAKQLSIAFTELGEKYKRTDIAHIGVAPFDPFGTIDGILLAANEAYEQAHLIGANSYFIRTSVDQAKDISEWKELVFNIVDNQDYNVSFIGEVKDCKTQNTIMVEAFTQALDKNGDTISIGTFVSIAEKFSKIIDLDKGVTSRVIDYIKTENIQHSVAVNLSTRTIKSSTYRAWLTDLLQHNQSIAQQLVFSISAYAVAKEVPVFKEFISFAHQLGVKVMIKRFDTDSISPKVAQDLNPDFIRLTRDISKDVANDDRKKSFIESMISIGELLDISILAESVDNENDLNCIESIGISGTSQ